MGKFLKSGSLCLLFALSLANCTRTRTAPDELVLGLGAEPSSLDPRFASDAYGMRIVGLIFDSLVRIGPNLQVEPSVAKSWNYKNLTYTLDLVPGLKFHNGRSVTPEDLIFSYQQFSSPKSVFSSSFNEVEKFEAAAIGDHLRITIKMKKFVANFLGADLAVYKILPKQETAEFPKKLIGTGPFQYVAKEDNEIVLERFDSHPLHVPKMKKLVFKIVHDDFTRYQKLMRGELDMCLNEIAIDKVPMFEKAPDRFLVYRYPSASMSYVLINLQDPILKSLEVRKALSQAINRPEIIRYKLEGLGIEATSILSKAHPDFNAELKNPAYDLATAQATIQKLGLKGKKLIFKSSNSPAAIDNSKVLSYQLSQTGLDVEFQSFEWGKFYDDVKRGNFQLASMKWVGISDADIYRNAFDSREKPPGGRNRGHYSNPLVDAVVEKAMVTESEEIRKKLYLQAQKLVFDDYAILPLWYEVQVAIMKKGITGFEPSITGDYSTLVNVEKSTAGLTAGSPLAGQNTTATSFNSRN
jgi:peptide/nickel transport system substrate-binding protein